MKSIIFILISYSFFLHAEEEISNEALKMDSIKVSSKLLEINRETFVKNNLENQNTSTVASTNAINRTPASTDETSQENDKNSDEGGLTVEWGKNHKPEVWIIDP